MKKNIKYISLCLLVAIGLISCEADDSFKDEPVDLQGYVHLLDRSITSFDENEDLELKLITTSGVTVDKVEILKGDSPIADATISGEIATFNVSLLGAPDVDEDGESLESYALKVRSTLSNGKTALNSVTINVVAAISIDDKPSSIKLQDTTKAIVEYSTFTSHATIDDVTLMWKKNVDGTYVAKDLDLDVDGEKIDIAKLDYSQFNLMVNDTVYFKFTAESALLTESAVAKVAISAQKVEASNSAVLANNDQMSLFHLGDAEYVDADGEIKFKETFGFETLNGIDFVKVTLPQDMSASDYFDNGDLLKAEQAYLTGNKLTSVSTVSKGDVFVYKTTRTIVAEEEGESDVTLVYYGIIKIGNVTVTNDTANSFEFDYAEGTIIRG
jgi:hypothetical protein